MITQIKSSVIQTFIKDENIISSFMKFQNKNSNSKIMFLKNKAVFIGILNKNKYYDIMLHVFKEENINAVLKDLKKHFNENVLLIYLRNKNSQLLYENIDSHLIIRQINYYYLDKINILPHIEIKQDFTLKKHEVNNNLENFFIECFKDEWDENVKKWFTAYNDYEGLKEVLVLEKQKKIVASIMYWINDKNIYIFLLGTNPNFRRKKLANFLIKQVQKNYPNLEMNLTVYSDSGAVHFYRKLGFVEAGISGVCI